MQTFGGNLLLPAIFAAACGGTVGSGSQSDRTTRADAGGEADAMSASGGRTSDDGSAGAASNGSGGAPATGGGSTGGSAGTGGAPDADAGTANVPPIDCSEGVCDAPLSETSVMGRCCRDDGTCGWTMTLQVPQLYALPSSCHAFQQPGDVDDACFDVTVTVGAAFTPLVSFAGCCRPDGRCGAIIHDTSGCVALEDVNGSSASCGD